MTHIEGEVGTVKNFVVNTQAGVARDLTGATVSLLVAEQAARAMVIDDATNGKCSYTTVAGENNTDGTGWRAQDPSDLMSKYRGRIPFRIRVVVSGNTFYSDPPSILTVFPLVPAS